MTNPPGEEAAADAKTQHPQGDKRGVVVPPSDVPAVPPQASPSPERFWTKNAVALGGIAATLITACVGSVLTYRTSQDNIAAERQQSSIEFQRAERKTAYSEFLTKALMMEDLEAKVDTTRYSRRPGPPDPQILDELNRWQPAHDQLAAASVAVDLFGSGPVRLLTLDVRDAHNDVSDAYVNMNLAYQRNPSDRQAVEAAIKQFESKRKDAVNARFEFGDAASESLGISLLGP